MSIDGVAGSNRRSRLRRFAHRWIRTPGLLLLVLTSSLLTLATAACDIAPNPGFTKPVPVIVDTDIFSDADDVGALATAFALQLNGTANVIAVGVDTRTSRPAVSPSQWKCVAAIAQFYGFPSVPIGTDVPANGTETNTPDFVGPCGALASPSTPQPDTAVNVYRRALASQADGSVVIVGIGYEENLAALLASPADSISPLDGHDLVSQKVKALDLMGGGFPSRNGETNLIGNTPAAQAVAESWPTKIVWSGYEVGDAIHTGNTISSVHPADSPVRVAYESFVGRNNWIYSYDLTAVYHAILPNDPLLTEVGPGTNVISNNGANSFTPGTGNQYYLSLTNATALDGSIEALLDRLPSTPPDTTPPLITNVATAAVTDTHATVSWVTDEPSGSQVDYGSTSAYGTSTPLDPTPTTAHAQTLSGLTPGTFYHYRVDSTDAAGNLAASGDFTFATATGPAPGPNSTFDNNVIDPAQWTTTNTGSTVVAADQQLEISHAPGPWSTGTIQSVTPYDQTGKSLQVEVNRAANAGLGGPSYGETSVFLWLDSSHYASFFFAGGSLTATVNNGSGEVNLTPNWPSYDPTSMQWVRFRESGGTLYFEYSSGATSPGTWNTLASTPDPFTMSAVTLKITAGTNLATTDTAEFDNIATY